VALSSVFVFFDNRPWPTRKQKRFGGVAGVFRVTYKEPLPRHYFVYFYRVRVVQDESPKLVLL